MAPTTSKATRKASSSKKKKKHVKGKISNQKTAAALMEDTEGGDGDDIVTAETPFSTPKAQRFRIPEMETCPPAPKKQRLLLSDCSLQKTPIAFFAPPDLELFFFAL
ncbi:hypothetical protein Gotri_020845 [Gossypium trilobum]|uniref:Uncharacterized protein n=1 Tax=Gossypium trilobum TaxID=34281 RepID=A0A7J9DB00_9ROSI|nr:hypothetical protein [Gossypium trilobum]